MIIDSHHPCGELKVCRHFRGRVSSRRSAARRASRIKDRVFHPRSLAELAGHKSLEKGVESFLGLRIEIPRGLT
jgi:hypothetical protein